MTWLRAVDEYLEEVKRSERSMIVDAKEFTAGAGQALAEEIGIPVLQKTTELATGVIEYIKNNHPANVWKGEEER